MLSFVNSELYNLVFFSLCCIFVVLTFVALIYATLDKDTIKEFKEVDSLENKQYKEFIKYIEAKKLKK